MPKVSVVIPVYGVEKYIERCARSLFEQTLDDIEYIFVDDCSPDKSMEILTRIIEEYRPRLARERKAVRIEKMPTNSGQAAVRRHGIQLCTGEYIIHCDSDDWVENEWSKSLYNKAINEHLDVVFCDYYRVVNEYKYICRNKCVDKDNSDYYIRRLLTKDCFTAVWNKLVKKDIFQIDVFSYPQCNMWEDYFISVQTFYFSKRIGYLNKPLYNYYCNERSICYDCNIENKIKQVVVNCNRILSFLQEHNLMSLYSKETIILKNNAKSEALTSYKSPKFYEIWRNLYPENSWKYLCSQMVSVKDKLRFMVIMFGIYPMWIKLKKKL